MGEEPDIGPGASGQPWGRGRKSGQVAPFTSLAPPGGLRPRGVGVGGRQCPFPPGLGTQSEQGERPQLGEPVPGFRSCVVESPGFTNEKTREPVGASWAV